MVVRVVLLQLNVHCPLVPGSSGPASLRHSAAPFWCLEVLQALMPAFS